MKIKKSVILEALKADLKASEASRKDIDAKIDKWKREHRGDPYGNEQRGKSKIVSREILKLSEWQHPTLLDPFVGTPDIVKVTPVTWEDTEAARQSELLLNYQFCRQFNRYNFMSKALKVLDQEGTVVVQTGWDYEDEEVEVEREVVATNEYGIDYLAMEQVTELKVLRNQPTAKVCRNEDVYIDPTCMDDMDNCQFVIHRYESDLSTLKRDGRYKNLEKIAMQDNDDFDFDSEDTTEFKFGDKARKKLVVYEYWGNYDINNDGIAEPIVCAWIGNTIIRLQDNPYPDKKPPFLVVPFNSVPFQLHGESDAELLSDNQKIATAVKRGIVDNMAQSNNGQKGIRKGALDANNKKKFINGQNFEFNGTPSDFWDGSYNQIPGSAFNMLALVNNDSESLTGTKSFNQGISGGSLGATATGARGVMDATATRKLNRVRNISENLVKPLMRKWLAYSNEFLNDEEIVRVTNEEFVEIRRDDLAGNVDLEIKVSTAEDNKAKAQEIAFMVQTLGNTMSEEMLHKMLAQWADLTKQPELAKEHRDWRPPQPTPEQQEEMRLELERKALENELLKAEIADKLARAGENKIDAQLKAAKVEAEFAKAKLTNEKADREALEFLKEDEGINHQREMEKKDFDRLANLDQLSFQAMQGDTNLGVKR